jgi:tRNA(fMet)-specific endonuclease VapC
MKVMFDTNVCISMIKRRPESVLDRFSAFTTGDIGISTVSLAELEYGAAKSAQPRKNREDLEEFVSPLDVAGFDRDAAEAYGRIGTSLEKKRLPIGTMDMLIAAHALSLGVNLLTNNEEFRRVSGLRVENWI